MFKKIALLCDYGLDDAVATLYLLKYAKKFERIDILPVGGNFSLEMSFNNAKRILCALPDTLDNVRLVDTSSIDQPSEHIPHIHGNDGMGDILSSDYIDNYDVIDYKSWLDGVDKDYTIISLGPCTVTVDILSRNGDLNVIMMAGNISEKPNYNGYEFNHGINPDSFSQTVKYKHVTATLDTCHNNLCDFNFVTLKEDTILERFIRRSIELSKIRGDKGCYIYDLIAVYYLMNPELFDVEQCVDPYNNKLSVLRYNSDKILDLYR